jgi:hypothetical protein
VIQIPAITKAERQGIRHENDCSLSSGPADTKDSPFSPEEIVPALLQNQKWLLQATGASPVDFYEINRGQMYKPARMLVFEIAYRKGRPRISSRT